MKEGVAPGEDHERGRGCQMSSHQWLRGDSDLCPRRGVLRARDNCSADLEGPAEGCGGQQSRRKGSGRCWKVGGAPRFHS